MISVSKIQNDSLRSNLEICIEHLRVVSESGNSGNELSKELQIAVRSLEQSLMQKMMDNNNGLESDMTKIMKNNELMRTTIINKLETMANQLDRRINSC
jgi:hypothetical protein